MTQKADLLTYLKRYKSITRWEAFRDLGIAELSSRIGELEHEGYIFPRQRVTVKARNGRKCRVMRYSEPIILKRVA